MRVHGQAYRSVWLESSVVRLIDQRRLPHEFVILDCPTYRDTAQAITTMAVRGAGAIGVAAGYAMAQAALGASESAFAVSLEEAARTVRATRPTAHDLFYAVERVLEAARRAPDVSTARQEAARCAARLADENAAAGERIGLIGEPLIQQGARILTQCNAGWLAFADWGSALAPIYLAHRRGKQPFVYVPETRPRSQGAKLTAWELAQEGVAHALIADTASGSCFQRREVDCVLVGADRIAANGDVANKIGTYTLALLAHHHRVPFYVAAPRSTFDLATPTGAGIPIEERDEEEVLWVSGRAADQSLQRVQISPVGTRARNPAFDVTPATLVSGFLTEAGLIPPQPEAIAKLVQGEATPSRLDRMAAGGIFEAVCRHPRAPHHSDGPALIALARSLHALDLTPSYGPGDHGNLSCRIPDGYLMSARQTRKATLREDQLVLVRSAEHTAGRWQVMYEGRALPSTDALMHLVIYGERPDIAAIIHAHDDQARARAQSLGLPVTQTSATTNSLEWMEEVRALCAHYDYVVLRDHGILALGRSLQAAEACLMAWYRRVRSGGSPPLS